MRRLFIALAALTISTTAGLAADGDAAPPAPAVAPEPAVAPVPPAPVAPAPAAMAPAPAAAIAPLATIAPAPIAEAPPPLLDDATFDAQFQCPETLADADAREDALHRYAAWAKETHPDWNLRKRMDVRYGLLRRHACVATMANIADSAKPPFRP